MPSPRALSERESAFRSLGERTFDLLVIGGGINGCGIARDAAMRGLSVALVEKNDFGSGTSSRTSRMIHGGVRYLEHGYFRLVLEASRERRTLLRIAPHLVKPMEFLWPVYEDARIGRLKLAAGLGLYDAFALFRNVRRHQRLSVEAVLAREPMLQAEGLRGGAVYLDAVTDDARLTIANALAARDAGAVVLNHAAAELDGVGSGTVLVRDQLSDAHARARARVVVVAIGPWDRTVRGTKGSHVLVPRSRTAQESAITFLSAVDQRVLFMVPEGSTSLIGTTDLRTDETPEDARASEKEILYLLRSANAILDVEPLTRADVISAWAGIRPLAAQPADEPASMSREHSIEEHDSVIALTGGKLTTYRAVAAQVVDRVLRKLDRPADRSPTDHAVLPGGDLHARVVDVVAQAPELSRRIVPEAPHRNAELVVAVRDELAQTLGDLLIRRTKIAFLLEDHGLAAAPLVFDVVAPALGWDAARCDDEVERYRKEVARIFGRA
jgi:glycerol-3-phosphate dehydrogenase